MTHPPDFFDFQSLAFFGRVNASISHELKNIMAIISETAGLLTDLSEMARKGNPIELDMLTESTRSIIEEIQRGFTTIRQMNRFSHSIDMPVGAVDLREIFDLVSHLCGYLSFAGELQIHSQDGDVFEVETSEFILQAVIYESAVGIFKACGPGTALDINIKPDNDSGWRVVFSGFSIKEQDGFPNDVIKHLAESIGVRVQCRFDTGCLEIGVPASARQVAGVSESSGSDR